MRKVELFELIRTDARRGMSVRALADRHGIHRRTVRQALGSAIPPERKAPERARPALTPEVVRFIDALITADRVAPRKQRHTARRIWQRVCSELGARIGESTVRAYVSDRRRELGVGVGAFVPQHHPDARQAEVDFYEAVIELPDGAQKAQIITVRAEASGAAFHKAYPRQTQSALLDGIAQALEFFGGVYEVMRFDNLTQAVARVLKGHRRQEQDRFIAFRSHYGFASSFTTPGIAGAHEKGGVEGEVGRFRRRWLVPIPKMGSYEELNAYLADRCRSDLGRRITGRSQTVGEALEKERELLQPLPSDPFDVSELGQVRVDQKARVSVRTNRYSVPARLVGRLVRIRLTPMEVEVTHDGAVVAHHPRLHLRYGERLVLDHYLELLESRPGAFAGSLALHQERERGSFSAEHQELWVRLKERLGETGGTRDMIEVLLLYRRWPAQVVNEAIRTAVGLGATDPGAVALLCRNRSDAPAHDPEAIEVGSLDRYDRPLPQLEHYDRLIEGAMA